MSRHKVLCDVVQRKITLQVQCNVDIALLSRVL